MWFLGLLILTACLVNGDEELRQGNTEFSASFYKQLAKDTSGNIVVSPLSIQLILALTQLGAKGETSLELSKALHLPNIPQKVKDSCKALLRQLRGNEFYSLHLANKIYLRDGYTINPNFLKLADSIFDAELETIDFSDELLAARTINEWVKYKTNNRIKNLVSPDYLDSMTRLVLVNALYFKGKWSSPFDGSGTRKRKFFETKDEGKDVDTMHQIELFKFVENKDLDAKFIEIPYEGGDITFTIALPNEKQTLSRLERRMSEVVLPQNYSYERISLYVPIFKLESTFELVETLKRLGVMKIFDDEADLTGLLANSDPLVVSQIVQKAFINVTETGTEASAASSVVVGIPLSAVVYNQDPIIVKVDRPFIFFIKHVDTNQILFTGRMCQL